MALTVDTVADTALRILSDFGLGDLTMRRLARELGVQPSALYWHVADKQSLFVLLAERISAEAEAATRPAETDHSARILTFREVLLRYRESAEIVILAYSVSGAQVLPAGLRELEPGLREQIVAFVLGAVAVEQSRAMLARAPEPTAAQSFRAGLDALLGA